MSYIELLTTGFIAAASLAAATTALSWLIARRLCKPRRRAPAKTPADYHLPFREELFFSGKRKLRGWFIPAQGSTHLNPTVILCHGWSSDSSRLLPLAENLHCAGLSVFLYDTRGHGRSESGGPVTGFSFAEDLTAAIDSLWHNHRADPFRIGVVGHSVGGVGAILAASMDPRISAVVSCSAFADPRSMLGAVMSSLHIPRWPFQALAFRFIERWVPKPLSQLAPLNRVHKVRSPIFLLHGGNDRIVSPSNLHRLAERAVKTTLTQWLEPTSGHSDLLLHPVAQARIVSFLRVNLCSTEGESLSLDSASRARARKARLRQVCMN